MHRVARSLLYRVLPARLSQKPVLLELDGGGACAPPDPTPDDQNRPAPAFSSPMLQMYVSSVSKVCCNYYIWMLHMLLIFASVLKKYFQTYVATGVLSG
jgi:hypothetical protein